MHRAADAERHRQQHRERNGPALVERGEQQEHHQHRQAEQERRLRARQFFLQRLPGPFVAEAARQLAREPLHLGDGVAGGEAGLGFAADAHRGIVVEAGDLRRALRPLHGGEGGERHQLAAAVLDVVIEDVVGVHAAGAVGLHDHALHPAAVREVVDVVRAEIGRDRLVDVLEGDAERAGLLAVDHQIDLRRRRQALDIDLLQHAGWHWLPRSAGRRRRPAPDSPSGRDPAGGTRSPRNCRDCRSAAAAARKSWRRGSTTGRG